MSTALDARATQVWDRICAYFQRYENSGIGQLAAPAAMPALDRLAEQLGIALPEEMRSLYRVHDGGFARVLPEGAWFRSVDEIASVWPTFAQLADDDFSELPAELVVENTHWDAPYHRGWVPQYQLQQFSEVMTNSVRF